MNVHEQFKKKYAVKAHRQHVIISHNPSTIDQNEDLEVRIPNLGEGDVIIPSSLELSFDIELTSTANTRHVVNNMCKALITKLDINYEGNEIQSIQNFDIFQIYRDMWISKHDQSLLVPQGLDAEGKINKVRVGAHGAAAAADAKENAVAAAYSKNFSIPIGSYFELTKHLPTVMINDRLSFILRFAPYGSIINDPGTGSGGSAKAADGTYKISKICLEFDKITSAAKANEARAVLEDISLPIERILCHRKIPFNKSDTTWNINVNMESESLTGLLLFFKDDAKMKQYDMKHSEFYNPLITKVSVGVESEPNQLYTHGMNSKHMYKSAYGYFGKENTAMNMGEFFTNGYCLFVDFRAIADNKLHGGGRRLKNTSDGVSLEITKKADESGKITCYVFVVQDAQLNFANGRFESLQYA